MFENTEPTDQVEAQIRASLSASPAVSLTTVRQWHAAAAT